MKFFSNNPYFFNQEKNILPIYDSSIFLKIDLSNFENFLKIVIHSEIFYNLEKKYLRIDFFGPKHYTTIIRKISLKYKKKKLI